MSYGVPMDRDMKQMTSVAMVGCALTVLVIFLAGWRSDGAMVAFIVCLGFLTLFGLARD